MTPSRGAGCIHTECFKMFLSYSLSLSLSLTLSLDRRCARIPRPSGSGILDADRFGLSWLVLWEKVDKRSKLLRPCT